MLLKDYLAEHPSIVCLVFKFKVFPSEDIVTKQYSNFLSDENNLIVMDDEGEVEYLFSLKSTIEVTETGFILHNKFKPNEMTVDVMFGGVINSPPPA